MRNVERFSAAQDVSVVHFGKGDCKEAIARRHAAMFEGDEGVVMIGVAQEKISSFRSYQKDRGQQRRPGQPPSYAFFVERVSSTRGADELDVDALSRGALSMPISASIVRVSARSGAHMC